MKVSEIATAFPAVIVGVDRDKWHHLRDGKLFIQVSCHACFELHSYYGQWTKATIRDAIGEDFRHCPETGRRLQFLDSTNGVDAFLRGQSAGIDHSVYLRRK